jgi:hypothetical protein
MRLDRTAFRLDGEPATLADALAALALEGALRLPGERLERRLALVALADAEGLTFSDVEIRAEIDRWRAARGLSAAEATEAWLDAHGLTLEDLADHAERGLAEARLEGRTAEALRRYPPERADRDELLAGDIAFEDDLDTLVGEAACRAAAPIPSETALARERAAILAEHGAADVDALAAALASLGIGPPSLRRALDWQAAYRLHVRAVATEEALARELVRLRGALVRVHFAFAELRSDDEARELIFCIREDKEPLDAVAARARARVERGAARVEDLPRTAASLRLARAAPGEPLGPFSERGRFLVYVVDRREDPDATDPQVRASLTTRIAERALASEFARRVRLGERAPS